MAGKISTLILTVDLECYSCTKKIRKTICKLQDREQIQSVAYDEKNNTVTISGLFDPQILKKKLLCKACKVIKDIEIKEEEKPMVPEKPKNSKPKKKKPKPQPEPEKEKPQPEPEKEKPKPEPVQPVCPVGPALPSCCCRPCYQQYYGGCRCSSCGMFYGWTAAPPPPPPAGRWMGGPSTSTCQFFCEKDPSCSIM